MEQYEIPLARYFQNIQLALVRFKAESIYIRLRGSLGGMVIISKKLKGKKLSVSKEKNGLNIAIGGKKAFFYETKTSRRDLLGDLGKRWAVAYERFYGDGRKYFLYPDDWERIQDNGPDDPRLPKVEKTILRSCNDYLVEITFSGKIPLKKAGLIPGYKNWHYWELNI